MCMLLSNSIVLMHHYFRVGVTICMHPLLTRLEQEKLRIEEEKAYLSKMKNDADSREVCDEC